MSDTLSSNNKIPPKIPTGKIPTPWAQQWKRIRYQLMPVLIAGAAFLGTGWLWNRHYGPQEMIGIVRVVQVDTTSPMSGVLLEPQGGYIKLYDRVGKNQVIARLDDAPLLAEMSVIQHAIDQLMKKIPAEAESIRLDLAAKNLRGAEEYRRLEVEVQQKTLEILRSRANIQTYQAILEKDEALLSMMRSGVAPAIEIVEKEKQIAETRGLINNEESVLKSFEEWLNSANSRLQQFTQFEKADVEALIQPIKAEIETETAKLNQIKIMFQRLNVVSPIDGYVSMIYRYPNQAVREGELVASIVNSRGKQIVAYIRDEKAFNPAEIANVEIRPIAGSSQVYSSNIESIGPAYEQVPVQHLRDPKLVEFGIPVMISVPNNMNLRPGQAVNVRFINRVDEGS